MLILVTDRLIRAIVSSFLGRLIVYFSNVFNLRSQNEWIDLTKITIALNNLPVEFNHYRIVQFSDLHIGTYLDQKKLNEVINKINKLCPDSIVITGDFVTFEPQKFAEQLTSSFKKLKPKDAILAILGNHDHWTNPLVIRDVFFQSGIIDLSNRTYSIKRNGASLNFCGVDDYMCGLDDLPGLFNSIDKSTTTILLVHEPDFAEISSMLPFIDLQLSGHSHGGQIMLPNIKPLFLPNFSQKYPFGLHKIKNMYLYTNRGLGTAEFQVRYHCNAEITLIELIRA